jgi:hypothetical protein
MSARTRQENRRALKRVAEIVPERRTVRVYTEGRSTEPEYIDALKRLPQFADAVALDITIVESGVSPSTLVAAARRDKEKGVLDVDSFWCVFDVEIPQPHADLYRAIDMAHGNDIDIAVSNPCFELWLILHLQDQAGYLTTEEAVRLRGKLDGSDGKHLDASLYMPLLAEAQRRSAWLRKKHIDDGTDFHQDNPSSSFDLFVARLIAEVIAAAEPVAASSDG